MSDHWGVDDARALATELISDIHPRWEHLSTVGQRADQLADRHDLPEDLAAAAWVHDIGYAPALADPGTGFHPVDGARHLHALGAPTTVVALVAWHTGAGYEAATRGLASHLEALPTPPASLLDVLTWIDLTTGPDGTLVDEHDRIAEILTRYQPGHPVHQAVTTSRPHLLASARRARATLTPTPTDEGTTL